MQTQKSKWRRAAFLILSLPALAIYYSGSFEDRWLCLWVIFLSLAITAKLVSWVYGPWRKATAKRNLCYWIWPRMNADQFLDPLKKPEAGKPKTVEWVQSIAKTIIGLILFFVITPHINPEQSYLIFVVALTGILLMGAFGSFDFLSCIFRQQGIDAPPMMNHVFTPTRLSDFWCKRWNMAFYDIAHKFVYRPVRRISNGYIAAWTCFLFSGLIHELVISIPAQSAYGQPTLYFLIQAAGIFIERSPLGKRLKLGKGIQGWVYCAIIILGPILLLFPTTFAENVMAPVFR